MINRAPGVRNADGKPISIPYLVDLEHDRRKPSDEVLSPDTLREAVERLDAEPAASRG